MANWETKRAWVDFISGGIDAEVIDYHPSRKTDARASDSCYLDLGKFKEGYKVCLIDKILPLSPGPKKKWGQSWKTKAHFLFDNTIFKEVNGNLVAQDIEFKKSGRFRFVDITITQSSIQTINNYTTEMIWKKDKGSLAGQHVHTTSYRWPD